MRELILSSLIIALVVSSCSRPMESPPWEKAKMYTLEASLPDSAGAGEQVTYSVRSYLPNSCWEYDRKEQDVNGFDVFVSLFMKKDPEDIVCLTVVTPVLIEGTFTAPHAGNYVFHFWRSDTLSLVDTLAVE